MTSILFPLLTSSVPWTPLVSLSFSLFIVLPVSLVRDLVATDFLIVLDSLFLASMFWSTEQEELVRSLERTQAEQSFLWRVHILSKKIVILFLIRLRSILMPFEMFHVECVCCPCIRLRGFSPILHLSAGFISMGAGNGQAFILILLRLCCLF